MNRTFRFTSLAVAALVLGAAACKDTTGIDEHGEEVVAMRLTIVGQPPVTVSSAGVASGSFTITNGVPATVTAEFLDADNDDALGEHADDFQLNVVTLVGLTFIRTGPFSGTLTGAAVATHSASFGLFHIEEAHTDFGPFNVTVNVVP